MKTVENYKEESKKAFNSKAKNYEFTSDGKQAKEVYKQVVEKVSEFNCKRVLDVGCGTGTILSILSKNRELQLSGYDLSEQMIERAQEKLEDKVNLKLGDSEELPWEKNTFDAVICTFSFHHYPNPEKVLNEMSRVMSENGYIIIADPWITAPFRQLTNLVLKYSNGGDYKIYSEAEITKLLNKAGFTSVSWNKVNCKAFIVTAKLDKKVSMMN